MYFRAMLLRVLVVDQRYNDSAISRWIDVTAISPIHANLSPLKNSSLLRLCQLKNSNWEKKLDA